MGIYVKKGIELKETKFSAKVEKLVIQFLFQKAVATKHNK